MLFQGVTGRETYEKPPYIGKIFYGDGFVQKIIELQRIEVCMILYEIARILDKNI